MTLGPGLLGTIKFTRWKVPIYHDSLFRSLLKTPPSTTILVGFVVDRKTFFLVSVDLYCHEFGKIMVDGRPVRVDVVLLILRPIFNYD
jgi:hypothetical protein